MLKAIMRIFSKRGNLQLEESAAICASLAVRPIQDKDLEACEQIYILNEKKSFPPGYFPDFATSLRNPENTFLVVEQHGQVRGVGGISVRKEGLLNLGLLCYGMVHPEHQGYRIGSLLLLARLSMLSKRPRGWVATMSCVPDSASYYQRFGFKWYARTTDPQGHSFHQMGIALLKADHAAFSNIIKNHITSPLPTLKNP